MPATLSVDTTALIGASASILVALFAAIVSLTRGREASWSLFYSDVLKQCDMLRAADKENRARIEELEEDIQKLRVELLDCLEKSSRKGRKNNA